MKKILTSENIELVNKLKKYLKKYYILIILNLLISMISGALSAAPVALIKRLFDKGLIGKNEKDVIYAALAMIVLAVIGATLMYYNNVFSGKISSSIYKNLIDDMYEKVQRMDMEYFSKVKIGELMTRITGDTGNVNTLMIDIFTFLSYVFTAIFYLIIAIVIDWKLTVGMIIVAPILYVTVKKYSKKLKNEGKNRQEAVGVLNSKIQETLSGIRVIKAFAKENDEIKEFTKRSTNLREIVLKSVKYNAKSSAISEALNYVMIALMLFFGGFRVIRSHNFTAGDFITIVGAISSMYTPIKRGMNMYNTISLNINSVSRIFEILEVEPKIIDKENCKEFEEFKETIKFEEMSFCYSDSNEKVLKNINLDIQKGETIALVGNSGGGKTTFVNLIPRFFDVTEGSILIDGINVKDYSLKSLRKNIGIVPQETFLFGGNILDNIKYGKQDATIEEVIEASKKANAHEFISKLKEGYNTEIGERGVKLSGGQKQRIAIARAILENPQILILDEATSALDNESEKLVQEALEKLMIGKTTFVIAHRLSTVINSDKIVVIQKGEIKEIGTHEELLEKKGIYERLYSKSFKN